TGEQYGIGRMGSAADSATTLTLRGILPVRVEGNDALGGARGNGGNGLRAVGSGGATGRQGPPGPPLRGNPPGAPTTAAGQRGAAGGHPAGHEGDRTRRTGGRAARPAAPHTAA
ncbi:hypothetical protein VM98_36090, partial [Streptomyces rubellomurinus subsp. indigoferus]